MQREQRWVAAAVVLAAGSVSRADPFDLALTTTPTANVAMGSGLYAASGAGATLAISDLQQAQSTFGNVTVTASGSILSSLVGPVNLSTATPNAPLQYTVFNAGSAFNAPGADFVLTNSATAAFSQDISIVATGAISLDSITTRLVPGAGVTSSSSSGYITLTGSTISVPNGLDSSVDPGVTSYRNSASVILTSTLGDIVAGPINASTPAPQTVAVPAYRVLVSSKGAVSLGTVNTSGPTAAGGIIISSFGNASCASIADGGLVSGSIAGVTVVSTGGLISIPGGISTTESVSARSTLYQTPPIDLQAASGVSTGSLVTSSPFTNNNAGSVTISTTATGGLTCNLINTSAVGQAGSGFISVTTFGPISIGTVVATGGANFGSGGASLTPMTSVSLLSKSSSVTVGNLDASESTGGAVSISGSTVSTGSLSANGLSGSGGSIALSSTGTISVGSVTASALGTGSAAGYAGPITLQGTGSIYTGTLTTNGTSTSFGGGFASNVGVISSQGSITVNGGISDVGPQNGNVILTALSPSQSVTVTGSIAVQAGVASGGYGIEIAAGGNVWVQGGISCSNSQSGGYVFLQGASVEVDGPVSVPNSGSTVNGVSVAATGNVTLPGTITATGSSYVNLTAGNNISASSIITQTGAVNLKAGSGINVSQIITSASPLIGPAVVLTSGGPLNLGYVSGTATATVTINAPTLALGANAGVFAGTLNFTTPASRNLRIVTGAVDPTSNIVDPTVLAALAPHVSTVSLGASGSGVMTLESPLSTTVALSFLTALTTTSTISVTSPANVTYNALSGNGTQIGGSASFAGSITPGLGGALGTLTFENVAAKASSSSTLNIAIAPTPQGGFDSLDFIGGSLNLNNETLALTFPQGVAPNSTYPIIELDGTALTGTFRGLANNAAVNAYGAIILHIEYTPTAVQIVSTPEPHWLATAVPAMVLLRRRRV